MPFKISGPEVKIQANAGRRCLGAPGRIVLCWMEACRPCEAGQCDGL